MVARGDLGVEMALEKVPRIQKSIIERARKHGKFVITATQMLESMIENPYPTRAEVSDVANAIYDGTDAVMLSAETSAGKYPVEAAKMMAKIALEAEASLKIQGYKDPPKRDQTPTYQETMADMAYRCARMQGATAIVVFTAGGSSARLVSKYRPPVPIFAFTGSEAVARQLSDYLRRAFDGCAGSREHGCDGTGDRPDAARERFGQATRQCSLHGRPADWQIRHDELRKAASDGRHMVIRLLCLLSCLVAYRTAVR